MHIPYSHLTDEELLLRVATKTDVTDLELELAERMFKLADLVESLEQEIYDTQDQP